MVKKYIVLIGLLWIGLLHATTIKLELENVEKRTDAQGKMVPTTYVGDTVTAQVTVDGTDKDIGTVTIDGLNQFSVISRQQSTAVEIINGVVTAKNTYFYQLQAQQPGNYTLGPARISLGGGRSVASDPISIQALPADPNRQPQPAITQEELGQIIEEDKPHIDQKAERVHLFCKAKTSDTQAFVGQPLELSLSIYARGPIVRLDLTPPVIDGFDIKEIKQFRRGKATSNNKQYDVREKKYILTPREGGSKKIPPIRVDYVYQQQQQRKRNRHGFFDDFFIDIFNQHRIQKNFAESSPLTIAVNSLPPYQGRIDGVGTFTKFAASTDKQHATINEPIMLKLEIEGKGNLDQIPDLSLSLPSHTKFYKSKIDLQEDLETAYLGGKKTFEYVLQITNPGTTTIAPQQFTFFDSDKKEYATLQTNPIQLTIEAGQEPIQDTPSAPHGADQEQNVSSAQLQKDIHFIEEDAIIRKTQPPWLPWWIFLLFLIVPILIFKQSLLITIKNLFLSRVMSGHMHRKKLGQFELKLATITQKGKTHKLYHFFLEFLAIKFGTEINAVSEQWIEQTLHKQKWDHEKITNFLDYLNECASIHFVSQSKGTEEQQALLKKATYWFLILNKEQ
ncbi:MAG: BatD family protein [bacterium]